MITTIIQRHSENGFAAETTVGILIEAKDKASASIKQVESSLGSMKSKAESMKSTFTAMAAVGTTVFAAVALEMKSAIKAYSASEVSIAKITATLNTMGQAGKDALQPILDMSQAAVRLGFDDEAAAESITRFYQATGSLTEAQKLSGLAMDLSRAKGIGLQEATQAVALALAGSGRALLQYGIKIKDGMTPLQALGELHDKVGGQAEAFANTYEGRMQALAVSMENIQEAIGKPLINMMNKVMEALLPYLTKIGEWIEKNPELTATILVVTAALSGLLAIVGLLGLALPPIITGFTLLSPVILPIIGIIAGLVWIIYNLNESIKIWQNDSELVILGVKEYWKEFKTFFMKIWTEISGFFTGIWDGIKSYFQSAINSIVGYFQPLISTLDAIWDKMTRLAGSAKQAGGKVMDAWSNAGSNIKWALGMESLSGKATGGSVTGGTPYMVGEAGAELFVPSSSGTIIPNNRLGNGSTIVVNINGGNYLSKDAAIMMGDYLIESLKQSIRI